MAVLGSCAHAPTGAPARDVYYPPPPATPRLKYLTHFSASTDVSARRGAFKRLVFGRSQPTDKLVKPYGVDVFAGAVYVCDTKRNLINVFDIRRGKFGYLGVQGRGRVKKPINITIDGAGVKYVADAGRGEIVVFDKDDVYAGAFGSGKLARPVDVAVHADKIYVCDAKTCEIVVFDRRTHRTVGRFGGRGTAPGKFARPTNIDTDSEGNVFVSDTINGRIQKCAPDGTHLMTIGALGDRMGQFTRPKGVAVDREGRIYAVDAAFENVQVFGPDGRLLLFFSGPGNGPGQLNLPAQVTIDYDNIRYFQRFAGEGFNIEYLVIVTSQFGPRKVNVYGFGTPGARN